MEDLSCKVLLIGLQMEELYEECQGTNLMHYAKEKAPMLFNFLCTIHHSEVCNPLTLWGFIPHKILTSYIMADSTIKLQSVWRFYMELFSDHDMIYLKFLTWKIVPGGVCISNGVAQLLFLVEVTVLWSKGSEVWKQGSLVSDCLRRKCNFLASTRQVTALCMRVCCIVCVCDCIMVIRKCRCK